jgi:hypothetical protein
LRCGCQRVEQRLWSRINWCVRRLDLLRRLHLLYYSMCLRKRWRIRIRHVDICFMLDRSLRVRKVSVLRLCICADVRSLRRMRHLRRCLLGSLLLYFFVGWSVFLRRRFDLRLPGESLMLSLRRLRLRLLVVPVLSVLHGVLL